MYASTHTYTHTHSHTHTSINHCYKAVCTMMQALTVTTTRSHVGHGGGKVQVGRIMCCDAHFYRPWPLVHQPVQSDLARQYRSHKMNKPCVTVNPSYSSSTCPHGTRTKSMQWWHRSVWCRLLKFNQTKVSLSSPPSWSNSHIYLFSKVIMPQQVRF